MCDINKFIWRFCVNYIPLNSVTRIIAYPIPCCDSAINEEFGLAIFFWLWDAPMGCHQLAVALASQEKLAFQGPNAIKWTHTVMPFGLTNGPGTFINFIHDLNSQWKVLAKQSGLVIDDDTNTKIIADDIFSSSDLLEKALLYMECQLCICQAYQLSLSLRKSCIFSKRFKFVGIDVCHFSFMTKDSVAVLHPVAFGAGRCRRNEVRLHSHLGEGFSGDWAMNKCRHMLFGQRFVWTTDCFAIKFILSYDGANPAILRLQMRLMCWDVNIAHQNDHYIADADY
jgi:hypothetical protein